MDNKNSLCYGCFSKKDYDGPCFKCNYHHEGKETPDQAHLKAGTVLNRRYIVGRLLGIGGFGITYIAFDPKLRVRLAIKEFYPRHISSRNKETGEIKPYSTTELEEFNNGLKYFLNEARSAAMFESHQNIVGVKDLFEENNTAYLVMPYISGSPFDSFLQKNGGKIDFQTALAVLVPIMDALSTIHENNLLHRDISPENIFITEDGIPKLLDFGSARPSVTNENLSMTPVIKEGYAPLEQYSRQGEQGPWTDIYSMAATFYKAVTGAVPPAAMERFGEDTLIAPNSIDAEIPGYAEKSLIKALSLSAADRFQNMNEFKEAVTKGKRIESVIYDKKKKSSNKKIIIAGISATFLIFLVSVASIFLFSTKEDKNNKNNDSEVAETIPEEPDTDQATEEKETDKKPKVVKKITPSKKKVKPAQTKKITKPVTTETVETKPEPVEEKKGVSMKGKNFVFSEKAPSGLSPQQYYKDGFKYELVRNYKQAEAYYVEACNAKLTDGCYRLGRLKKDSSLLSKARKSYSAECKKGSQISCTTLADMMLNGEGGAKEPHQAVTILANQCSKENVNSCFLLAGILEKGQGIKQDYAKAKQYYLNSCNAGSKDGCMKYAEMLEKGVGGNKDIEKAKEYYNAACKKGVARACMKANSL
jgi:serine/threonine protein kinase